VREKPTHEGETMKTQSEIDAALNRLRREMNKARKAHDHILATDPGGTREARTAGKYNGLYTAWLIVRELGF
jgi:hypothetical protein